MLDFRHIAEAQNSTGAKDVKTKSGDACTRKAREE